MARSPAHNILDGYRAQYREPMRTLIGEASPLLPHCCPARGVALAQRTGTKDQPASNLGMLTS